MTPPDEILSLRKASCGAIGIFEHRFPTGEPVYVVTRHGEVMAEVQTWSDALSEFKKQVRAQTEATLTAIK